jgi:hypothetical protein
MHGPPTPAVNGSACRINFQLNHKSIESKLKRTFIFCLLKACPFIIHRPQILASVAGVCRLYHEICKAGGQVSTRDSPTPAFRVYGDSSGRYQDSGVYGDSVPSVPVVSGRLLVIRVRPPGGRRAFVCRMLT